MPANNTATNQTINIANCPRCGQAHSGLDFAPLANTQFTWWATCPVTNQPVLHTSNIR
jgi:hypothetical protein